MCFSEAFYGAWRNGREKTMMTNPTSDDQDIDPQFDPEFVEPRRGLSWSARVLAGVTALIGGALTYTIAMTNDADNAHVSAANAEPAIHDYASTQNTNILAHPEAPEIAVQEPYRPVSKQAVDPLEQPLQLSDLPAPPAFTGLEQGSVVSANLASVDRRPALALAPPDTILVEQQPPVAVSAAWRVQLISLTSQKNAGAVWTSLQHANGDLLDGLTLHVQMAELDRGTFYRVQAGPLSDRTTAVSLCNSLKSRKQDCLVVAP